MAQRRKAKAQPRKKRAIHKKQSAPRGKKRKAAGGAIIGVVSSIKFTGQLKQAVAKGGNFSAAQLSVADSLGYSQTAIQTALSTFNSDSNIKLIITVGGGITYQAAANLGLTKPFISIVGETPTNQAAQCYGGVTLQSVQEDIDRIGYLTNAKGINSPAAIGLYYNPNSAMATNEKAQWPGGQVVAATVPNNSNNYAGDLGNFGNTTTAIVVSADPFFQDTKEALIAAANNITQYVCYSVQEFGNANGKSKPKHGKATMHGASLQDAYSLIGILAQNVLANGVQWGFFSCRKSISDA
jgi:predicted enzyme related to lactoylglutathione lyase